MLRNVEGVFWPGNSAKTRIIREIVQAINNHPVLIFDYGCGKASGWRHILERYPNIKLVGYDPDEHAIRSAERNLQGLSATFYTGRAISELSFQADYIISFSVLEHVYNRRQYLQNAKRLLAQTGIFYLNYDDGHFRVNMDLTAPSSWVTSLRVYLHNALDPCLPRIGLVSKYQRRVSRLEIEALVKETGFQIADEFYSNLSCFKGLFKYIPKDKEERFMELWINVENILNEEFRYRSSPYCGDFVNLWRFMASRTLILRHAGK